MALLDTIQLLLAVISGSHVAPALTVILVHFNIPLATFFHQCVQSQNPCCRRDDDDDDDDDDYSNNNNNKNNTTTTNNNTTTTTTNNNVTNNRQTNTLTTYDEDDETTINGGKGTTSQQAFGASLVLLSTVLALSPAVLTLVYPDIFPPKNIMANRTAWNTMLFVLSCVPGAASQVYKERAMASFARPVDSNHLNFLLCLLSLLFATLVSPLFYSLQGLADVTAEEIRAGRTGIRVSWWINLYPYTEISTNTRDGLLCFLGTLDDPTQINGYPESADCGFCYGIALFHVLSTVSLHHAVHRIYNAGATKIMHRGLSAGIGAGVATMMYYQIFIDDHDYGLLPNSWQITCAVVLVLGSEVYHRVSLEEPSFETKYVEVDYGQYE